MFLIWILNPPMLDALPQAVITASVLVHADAGRHIGWFDVRFREAGKESGNFLPGLLGDHEILQEQNKTDPDQAQRESRESGGLLIRIHDCGSLGGE